MEDKQLNDKIEDILTDPVERLLQEKKPASNGKMLALLALVLAVIAVAASGIRTREDIKCVKTSGIRNFLIGESLVRAENPRMHLKKLLSAP